MRKTDISTDDRIKKEYNRTIYVCDSDDIYITVEIPKEGN